MYRRIHFPSSFFFTNDVLGSSFLNSLAVANTFLIKLAIYFNVTKISLLLSKTVVDFFSKPYINHYIFALTFFIEDPIDVF
jgi:hypothetical protein